MLRYNEMQSTYLLMFSDRAILLLNLCRSVRFRCHGDQHYRCSRRPWHSRHRHILHSTVGVTGRYTNVANTTLCWAMECNCNNWVDAWIWTDGRTGRWMDGHRALWLIDRFGAFLPKGRGLESHSSRHVGTLGKSFTHNCLRREIPTQYSCCVGSASE